MEAFKIYVFFNLGLGGLQFAWARIITYKQEQQGEIMIYKYSRLHLLSPPPPFAWSVSSPPSDVRQVIFSKGDLH